MTFLRPIQWYDTTLIQIQSGRTVPLKVLTDHSNWETRVGSFDPLLQTGGFFKFHFKGTLSPDQQKPLDADE